jgi:hypothetical protein
MTAQLLATLQRHRRGLQLAAIVAVVVGACWALNFAWWWLLPPSRTVELVIPPGTSSQIAAGEAVSAIPDELTLRRGDRLMIVNEDIVVHEVGTALAPPGRSTRVQVTDDFLGRDDRLVCSIHPSGAIGLSSVARPPLVATLVPSLIAGVPLSIALLLAILIAGQLDARVGPEYNVPNRP